MSKSEPLRLNKYMLSTRFEYIFLALRYTDKNYLEYNDGLFHMCQMEESQNMNMSEKLNP